MGKKTQTKNFRMRLTIMSNDEIGNALMRALEVFPRSQRSKVLIELAAAQALLLGVLDTSNMHPFNIAKLDKVPDIAVSNMATRSTAENAVTHEETVASRKNVGFTMPKEQENSKKTTSAFALVGDDAHGATVYTSDHEYDGAESGEVGAENNFSNLKKLMHIE